MSGTPGPGIIVDAGLTASQLAAALVGPGVEVSNATFTGGAAANASFSFADPTIVGFNQGIILSSGSAIDVVGPNVSDSTSTDFIGAGDTDLDALSGYPTQDAAVLEFDFIPTANQVVFQYAFASEEYPEWVNTPYNDVFAFYVNNTNYATVRQVAGDPSAPFVPVAVNNINNSNPVQDPLPPAMRPDLFRANYYNASGASAIDLELDGITNVLTFQAPVHPGVLNHMKLAIADASDGILDSAVFIQGGSLISNENPVADLSLSPEKGPAPLLVTAIVEGEDPNGAPLTYSIDWGDGTFSNGPLDQPSNDSEKTALVQHTYTNGGDYLVTLTVSNGLLSGTSQEDLTVSGTSAVPNTVITAHPATVSNNDSPSFSFTSTKPGSTFTYKLDGADYVPGVSGVVLGPLADGVHTFLVRATDNEGNTDPTPAQFTWTIDTLAPDTLLLTFPTDPSSEPSPSFTFIASEPNSTFQYQIDSDPATVGNSGDVVGPLADGPHTFQVWAIDAAGNADATPAAYSWTINSSTANTSPTASGIRDVTVAMNATPITVNVASYFNDAEDGPLGLTYTVQDIQTSTPSPVALATIESGLADERTEFTLTPLNNGKLLVAGGSYFFGTTQVSINSVEMYDPATQTWTTVAPMHEARSNPSATLLPDGRVLVSGGIGSDGVASSAEIYDPKLNAWTTVGAMSAPRVMHTTTVLPSGKVLAVGGLGSDASTSTDIFDPATNRWTAAAPLTTWRWTQTATALADGTVLVVGGLDVDSNYLASAERYDPVLNSWTPAGALTAPRRNHAATLLANGEVLVTGGSSDNVGGAEDLAERYDPATNQWTKVASMESKRIWHTSTRLPTGEVLVAGGSTGSGPDLATAEIYDPVADAWSPAGLLLQARSQHGAALANGRVIIVGGLDFSQGFPPAALATSEAYDPSSANWTLTAPQFRLNVAAGVTGTADITVRATDSSGAWVDDTFQIVVQPGHAPADLQLSRHEVFGNTPGAWIASVHVLDNDPGDHQTITVNDQRFIVSGGQLYLQTGASIDPLAEPAVNLELTAVDAQANTIVRSFALDVMPRPATWSHAHTSPYNRYDVDADGLVAPIDALLIINQLNAAGPASLPVQPLGTVAAPYLDVSADNIVAPLDALLVINYLNAGASGEAVQSIDPAAADSVFADWTAIATLLAPTPVPIERQFPTKAQSDSWDWLALWNEYWQADKSKVKAGI